MNEAEKKKLMEGFLETTDKKTVSDPWTEEEIIKNAEKQLRKLGVLNGNEKLQ